MRYEMYRDARSEWRWRLVSANNRVISVSSESYVNRSDCEHSINLNKSSHSSPVHQTS